MNYERHEDAASHVAQGTIKRLRAALEEIRQACEDNNANPDYILATASEALKDELP